MTCELQIHCDPVGALSHLDVFDSTADQAAGLERIPAHVKDLWEEQSRGYAPNGFQNL